VFVDACEVKVFLHEPLIGKAWALLGKAWGLIEKAWAFDPLASLLMPELLPAGIV